MADKPIRPEQLATFVFAAGIYVMRGRNITPVEAFLDARAFLVEAEKQIPGIVAAIAEP